MTAQAAPIPVGTRTCVDACGRRVKSLRVSVTDRCNLRCIYCLPHGDGDFMRASVALSLDDIVRVVRVACRLGIDNVRLTGGEPLVRRGVPALVARLKRETAVREVAMTANGVLLERHVQALADAGLDRLTSTGDVRPCLTHDTSVSLGDRIRAGDEAGIEAGVLRAAALKSEGHACRDGGVTRIRMSRIGG